MTQELIERLEPMPNPRATPGARRAPIDEALAFLRANRDTHSRWAEYFEQNPATEAEYIATGVWEGAADQRRVERQYNAAIRTFETAVAELQSQSARIAELQEVVKLAQQLGPRAAQLMDSVRQEWSQSGDWTEWDQQVRDETTAMMRAIDLSHQGLNQ